MRPGFAGGQMPIYMRLGKLRGNTSKDAMPVGPFRTYTVPVNLRDLDRFDAGAEVTPESLVEVGLIKNTKIDVKLLGDGEVSKKLTVRVHRISASAREKIGGAGGTVEPLREPKVKKVRPSKRGPGSVTAPVSDDVADADDDVDDVDTAESDDAAADETTEAT